jgi:hypothetical protein
MLDINIPYQKFANIIIKKILKLLLCPNQQYNSLLRRIVISMGDSDSYLLNKNGTHHCQWIGVSKVVLQFHMKRNLWF